jgi:hypothetical protein
VWSLDTGQATQPGPARRISISTALCPTTIPRPRRSWACTRGAPVRAV